MRYGEAHGEKKGPQVIVHDTLELVRIGVDNRCAPGGAGADDDRIDAAHETGRGRRDALYVGDRCGVAGRVAGPRKPCGPGGGAGLGNPGEPGAGLLQNRVAPARNENGRSFSRKSLGTCQSDTGSAAVDQASLALNSS